jgi:putative nucleotidyltransferase with HDIG domain
MGEQPAKDQSVPGSKTAPLNGDIPLAEGLHAAPPPSAPTSSGGSQPQGLRAWRRAILTLRSQPTGPDNVQFKGSPRHLVISGILLMVIITLIMTVPLLPGQVQIQPGVPASQDIFSPTFLRYESKVLTDKAREDAANDPANEVWVQDNDIIQRQRALLVGNLSAIDALRVDESVGVPSQPRRQPVLQGITLTQQTLNTLLALTDSEYQFWRNSNVLIAYDAVMRDRRLVSATDVADARATLPDRLAASLSADEKSAAIAFLSPLITINMSLDQDQTAERRQEAINNVKPVIQTVQKGEAILRQGELATPEAIEKMQEAGLLSRDVSVLTVLSTGALVGILMLLMHLYIFRYAPAVWKRQRQIWLVGLLIIGTIFAARLLLPGHSILPYLLPVAAVSMLIAVLIDTNVAVLVTVVLAVLTGLVATGNNLSMELPLYYFVGGLAGIFSLRRVEKVNSFAVAGAFIALASFLTALALRVLAGNPVDGTFLETLALEALFVGGVAAAVTYASFSVLGTIFGITTPLQLMELAHPDQPVLRRLMREAPGTYHHSLVVSNLAERAAEMIGADALLTRVCAYYHDIGKVVKPYYFIDNQSGMKNVHDDLPPRESAAIIAGHVTDGLELGRKSGLPRRVLDAIPQHHGTMLIKYFYVKALQEDPNTDPDDFRYPGPKPQTKENAILMLADGVEATVRAMAQAGALDKPAVKNSDASESPGLYNNSVGLPDDVIADVVHKTISERIEDGQLDECDLTVRDIARIQEAFVSMLKGIYHPRVQYPEAPKRTEGGGDQVEAAESPDGTSQPMDGHTSPLGEPNGRSDGSRVPGEIAAISTVPPNVQNSVMPNVYVVGTNGHGTNGQPAAGEPSRPSMSEAN